MKTLDWLVLLVYAIGLVLFGLLVARRESRSVDYFLAARSMRWPTIGFAMFAGNMSSTALVGLAGASYAIGISVYDYEWSAIPVLIFFSIYLLPAVIRSGIFTMPEFLERRYDRRLRTYFAVLTLFITVLADSAGVLYSGSLVCRLFFPRMALWEIIAILAGAAALYAAVGGLRSVLYTEAIQGAVLIVAAVVISLSAFKAAGGWQHVMTTASASHLSLIRPIGDPGVPWLGLVIGIPLLGFYYWCANQSMVQRLLSARDVANARWGALLTGFLKLPVLVLIVLPGICAMTIFPGLARPDMVYPNLILNLLPTGLVGLVTAAFVASTIVAMASMFNSASTLITFDIVKYYKPALSDVITVRVARYCTVFLSLLVVGWTPQLERFPSLWQYLQAVLAYAVPPVVVVFAFGLCWRRASAAGAAATMVFGSLAGIFTFAINAVAQLTHLHFLYVAPILAVIDAVILIVVSYHSPDMVPKSHAWRSDPVSTTSNSTIAQPLWQDHRVIAAVLLAATATTVFLFR